MFLASFFPFFVSADVSLSGTYNSFSGAGFTAGDYFQTYIFDSASTSVGNMDTVNLGATSFSNKTVVELGNSNTLANGTYYMLVYNSGAPDDIDSICGAGKTLSDCETGYGFSPAQCLIWDTCGYIYFTVADAPPTGDITPLTFSDFSDAVTVTGTDCIDYTYAIFDMREDEDLMPGSNDIDGEGCDSDTSFTDLVTGFGYAVDSTNGFASFGAPQSGDMIAAVRMNYPSGGVQCDSVNDCTSQAEYTGEAVIYLTYLPPPPATTTIATSTPYYLTKDEYLFVYGVFLFMLAIPFWARIFNVNV